LKGELANSAYPRSKLTEFGVGWGGLILVDFFHRTQEVRMSVAISTAPKTLVDIVGKTSERTNRIVRDAVLVVSFAVFTAVLAQVRFNLGFTPVPITGQTLAVLLSGTALGWRRGALSMGLYWLAGIFMPIAWYASDDSGTSVKAGWHIATGSTAGYLFGFVVAAAFVGYLAERGQDRHVPNGRLVVSRRRCVLGRWCRHCCARREHQQQVASDRELAVAERRHVHGD
jgi:biotin transporter BioY